MKLRYKLALYNLLTKAIFVAVFLLLMPYFLERVNIIQTDNELIRKREQVIDIIAEFGVEGLMADPANNAIGSYNILKQEYISLEKTETDHFWNFIEITQRMVDEEIIDYRVLNYSFMVDGEIYLLEIGTSLDNIYKTERNIRSITLVLLGLFVIISFIADTTLARILTRPLEHIAIKLKKTKTPALFDKNPIKTTTTDFKYLDRTLGELMEKIDQLFAKEREITANISHELLTPISVIQSRLENLISSPGLDQESAIKVNDCLKTLHRLKSIINSLLLIARVESQEYLKNESFSIIELIREVIDEIQPLAEDQDIRIEASLTQNFEVGNANRALLYTLFFNIINNAVKFSKKADPQKVEITTFSSNGRFAIKVKDHGPGMSPEQAKMIFERFRKGKSEDGYGLGLAISKTIADFHQINIKVETLQGKGTSFILIFSENL